MRLVTAGNFDELEQILFEIEHNRNYINFVTNETILQA